MTEIRLITKINAPLQTVFDLARNIDAHMESTSQTYEKVVSGRKSGLIELGESVTWEAIHFGLKLHHESKITAMEIPSYFVDEMVSGCFKSFRHEHLFSEENGVTTMTDVLEYRTPFWILGRIFDVLILRNYMTELLRKRNLVLKASAEKT